MNDNENNILKQLEQSSEKIMTTIKAERKTTTVYVPVHVDVDLIVDPLYSSLVSV